VIAVKLTKPIVAFYWSCHARYVAGQVARRICPELQQAAWRKVAAKRPTEEEFNSYLEARAAQLAQPLVDERLKANPGIPAILGNKLVVLSARQAVNLIAKPKGWGRPAA
jgi:hypothetical protein